MRRRPDPWLAGLILVAAFSLGRFTTGPFMGDDDYVLHNLASPGLRDVLFAYNVDLVRGEGGQTTWYEGFETLQRRYVRVVPSALMAVEYRLFGSSPVPLKAVSLLLHLLCLTLGYILLSRRTERATAAAVVALAGLHPAAAECILWFACQPILWAALGSLVAAHALVRLRERQTIGRQLAMIAGALAALFSYEAAVAVPLLLVGFDWLWARTDGRPRPSAPWASGVLLAAYPLYGAVSLWNRVGTTLTDASYRAGVLETLTNVRTDLANYVVKVLPVPPYGAGAYAAIGSWAGAAVVASIVVAWLIRMGPSRPRTLGLWIFAATLAPSLLTRAAVSVLNFPSLRQLYLPLAGVAVLLWASRPAGFRRAGMWISGVLVLALVALYQVLGPAMVRSQDRVRQQAAAAQLADLLEGVAAEVPIVQVGQSSCDYSLSFHARGRDVWPLIPPTTEGAAPLLRALDDRTLEVQAGDGRTLTFFAEASRDTRARRRREVPLLLTAGSQRLGLATAHSPERTGGAVTAFRLTFDRPLQAYAFVRVSGCVAIERWNPQVAGR